MLKVSWVFTVSWMITWFIGSHLYQFLLVDFPSYFGFETSFPIWIIVFISGISAFLIIIQVIKKEDFIEEKQKKTKTDWLIEHRGIEKLKQGIEK